MDVPDIDSHYVFFVLLQQKNDKFLELCVNFAWFLLNNWPWIQIAIYINPLNSYKYKKYDFLFWNKYCTHKLFVRPNIMAYIVANIQVPLMQNTQHEKYTAYHFIKQEVAINHLMAETKEKYVILVYAEFHKSIFSIKNISMNFVIYKVHKNLLFSSKYSKCIKISFHSFFCLSCWVFFFFYFLIFL